ncbi:hypothetical protein M8J76_012683 [Diaphorina citri]|nr:hypothetical protein M8J76_005993 [Diaphorina citri]KAI5741346.1 hypothetical protein M8J76_012683 [Diaphorina citri]KAI5746360.1 hypothetical protein M8J77_002760 [Diaphorina citri]
MIEVCAKLVGGPVYLPGDRVGCWVTFTNPPLPLDKRSQSNIDTLESLGWASAQIHCLCTTSGKLSGFVNEKLASPEKTHVAMSNTSFAPCRGDSGKIILSTKPRILFCDLRLSPGESKSYLYSEVLPHDCPPTFRGQLVKYSYKITVGTQRVNCATKLLSVPIRVLVIHGISENSNLICEDSVDLSPSNPFLESKEKETELTTSLQILQNITARRSLNYFNVTNARGKVTRFCLFKQAYKLGEDIVATLDFTSATVRCVQFTVTLQSEEKIPGRDEKSIESFNNFHEYCLNMKQCFINLPIPLHVTPAFTTSIVSLRWRLHFEFVTSLTDPNDYTEPNGNDYEWRGPNTLDIETMVWDLPIQLYPALPTTDPLNENKYSIEV